MSELLETGSEMPLAAVPPPRGIVASVVAALPDLALAGWLTWLLVVAIRQAEGWERHADTWKWWFAYELFSLFVFFIVTVFNVRLVERNQPELKGKMLRDQNYWISLGICLAVFLALLAKASHDMFGDFSMVWCFSGILAVKAASLAVGPNLKSTDQFVEHGLQVLVAMPVALALGFGASRTLGMIFLEPLPPLVSDGGEHHSLLRLWGFLVWGVLFYLFMAGFAFLLAHWPRFTLAGLDERERRKGQFRT